MNYTKLIKDVSKLEERDEIANRLFFRLYQSSNLMHKVGTSAVSDYGTTTQQWAVLGALSHTAVKSDGLNVKQLMEHLMVSRQSLTALLNRLEDDGWLERVTGEDDKRIRRIRLTQKGASKWEAMRPSIFGFYESALKDFSTEEGILLMRLLTRLTHDLARL